MPMIRARLAIATVAAILGSGAQAGEPDYLCITGFDRKNADVWLLRSDGQMLIVEDDGKVETTLECAGRTCDGEGFTVSFASSFEAHPEITFATVTREGDPSTYVLQCERRN